MQTLLLVILAILILQLILLGVLIYLYRKHFHWLYWLAHDFKDLNAYLYTTLSKQRNDTDNSSNDRADSGHCCK